MAFNKNGDCLVKSVMVLDQLYIKPSFKSFVHGEGSGKMISLAYRVWLHKN